MSTTLANPTRRRTAVGLVAGLASLGLVAGVGGGAGAAPTATPASTQAAPAATGALTYSGQAFGTRVSLAGDLLNSGPTALANLGCLQNPNASSENVIAGVEIPGLADVGAVESTL